MLAWLGVINFAVKVHKTCNTKTLKKQEEENDDGSHHTIYAVQPSDMKDLINKEGHREYSWILRECRFSVEFNTFLRMSSHTSPTRTIALLVIHTNNEHRFRCAI